MENNDNSNNQSGEIELYQRNTEIITEATDTYIFSNQVIDKKENKEIHQVVDFRKPPEQERLL